MNELNEIKNKLLGNFYFKNLLRTLKEYNIDRENIFELLRVLNFCLKDNEAFYPHMFITKCVPNKIKDKAEETYFSYIKEKFINDLKYIIDKNSSISEDFNEELLIKFIKDHSLYFHLRNRYRILMKNIDENNFLFYPELKKI